MSDPNLSIMVVDDARFSSALIGRVLQQAGYRDIRYAGSASEALAALDQRPAHVLLADWLMPEMNGLQLTTQIRQLDESGEHYTYIILLTGSDGDNLLTEAFDCGVDDFVNKAAVNEQLLPRVRAADRLCGRLQRLEQETRRLAHNVNNLEQRNVIDELTGLGNLRFLRQHLGDALRQLESRGGALCYLLIGLDDPANRRNRGEGLQRELLYNVACRLRNMLRPLDALVRLDDSHFAVVAMVDDLRECSHSSFRRLHDSLNLKALKTSEGFITLQAAIALVGVDARDCPVSIDTLMRQAAGQLVEARSSGRIACQRLQQPQASAS
ncbi:MAG: response regulator [Pseudomonas sp.]|nr:response regulator [Pseudomonas sp.]